MSEMLDRFESYSRRSSSRGLARRWALLTAATALLLGMAGGARGARAQEPARRTVWDGVYMQAQAGSGATTFGITCARCHGAEAVQRTSYGLTYSPYYLRQSRAQKS